MAWRVQDSKEISKTAKSERNPSNTGIPDPDKNSIIVSNTQNPPKEKKNQGEVEQLLKQVIFEKQTQNRCGKLASKKLYKRFGWSVHAHVLRCFRIWRKFQRTGQKWNAAREDWQMGVLGSQRNVSGGWAGIAGWSRGGRQQPHCTGLVIPAIWLRRKGRHWCPPTPRTHYIAGTKADAKFILHLSRNSQTKKHVIKCQRYWKQDFCHRFLQKLLTLLWKKYKEV